MALHTSPFYLSISIHKRHHGLFKTPVVAYSRQEAHHTQNSVSATVMNTRAHLLMWIKLMLKAESLTPDENHWLACTFY